MYFVIVSGCLYYTVSIPLVMSAGLLVSRDAAVAQSAMEGIALSWFSCMGSRNISIILA